MLFSIDMRSPIWLVLSLFVLGAGAQQEAKFVVLSAKLPDGIVTTQETWSPIKTDIDKAESSISQIASLKGNYASIQIDHPERYFRQYVPIRQEGRKLLYVNAFCEAPSYWHTQLVIVDDGGSCFWQALYDPATDTYSHLTINGRA
jgi:hypothetical protein